MSRPLVAVFVGTDHHRFDRLLDWVTLLSAEGSFRFWVQHGFTPLPPGIDGEGVVGLDRMLGILRDADAVVTHGGPGSIIDARQAGHRPVVVPRDPRLGEHVDGHQQRFVRRLAATGTIVAADDLPGLRSALGSVVTTATPRDGTAELGDPGVVARFETLLEHLVHP